MTKLEVGFETDMKCVRKQFMHLMETDRRLRSVINAFDELACCDIEDEDCYPQFWRLTLERSEGA